MPSQSLPAPPLPEQLLTEPELAAYFQRIGYSGDRSPTLAVLQAIHQRHVQTIAFENLTPLLRQPVLIDLPALQQKLIHQGRGGYCFEQNSLFRAVLLTLGFQVTSLAARVLWNIPATTLMPRTHMVLRVTIAEESYITDVGFGGLTLPTPLKLIPNLEQPTSHEPFRLIEAEHGYTIQALVQREWRSLYRFDLQEQHFPDYEVSNWYVSTHPSSLFVNTLVVARPDSNGRYALRDNHFLMYSLAGRKEHRLLTTVAELRGTLQEVFYLNLDRLTDLDPLLQQVIDRA